MATPPNDGKFIPQGKPHIEPDEHGLQYLDVEEEKIVTPEKAKEVIKGFGSILMG